MDAMPGDVQSPKYPKALHGRLFVRVSRDESDANCQTLDVADICNFFNAKLEKQREGRFVWTKNPVPYAVLNAEAASDKVFGVSLTPPKIKHLRAFLAENFFKQEDGLPHKVLHGVPPRPICHILHRGEHDMESTLVCNDDDTLLVVADSADMIKHQYFASIPVNLIIDSFPTAFRWLQRSKEGQEFVAKHASFEEACTAFMAEMDSVVHSDTDGWGIRDFYQRTFFQPEKCAWELDVMVGTDYACEWNFENEVFPFDEAGNKTEPFLKNRERTLPELAFPVAIWLGKYCLAADGCMAGLVDAFFDGAVLGFSEDNLPTEYAVTKWAHGVWSEHYHRIEDGVVWQPGVLGAPYGASYMILASPEA